MKQHLNPLRSLLTGGLLLTILTVYSCSAPRQVTQLVRDVRVDTLYLSNTQYDSIYIFKDKLTDRSTDTVFIKDVSVEYRYKMLRDTVRVVQRDSIPYEVTVVQTKEIVRPLTWFDKLTRACFWIVISILSVYLIQFVFKLKTHFRL